MVLLKIFKEEKMKNRKKYDEVFKAKVVLTYGSTLIRHYLYRIISTLFKKAKLKRFFELVQKWYDDIDVNIDTDLNFAEIDNKEKKIRIFRRSSSREL